ncbi:cytochrome c biogenesis protein ResB [Microbacterium karelineae]|uniref:cytochrome c biogenesis protein ResB n=1 Tax=Microbacterium karelineae TaxID=2654283 RepID=UPI0012EA19E1|nr:cytochrome c biogenesis protein ResB [Microbacterium karelineae]
MSSSRSDLTNNTAADPRRPDDHYDSAGPGIAQPTLGVVGWLRWGWRQLTSMRTALVLLLLLAIAAIPGSIFPQRMANPNGVTQWESDNPDLFPIVDALQLFDVYSSAWFSAIYLLLFVSLIGCILPRTKHHLSALRARPPRTPARLGRLADFRAETLAADPERAVAAAEARLRKQGYRVERYDSGGSRSVSAERGYLRETGNLLFHTALVGILVAVGLGGQLAYTGQSVIIEGTTFVNSLLNYSSMNKGRLVADDALAPYSMTLDSFDVTYVPYGQNGAGQAGDFSANVTVREADGSSEEGAVRVNHPLRVHGDAVYLLGNGYAPTITVRDADGEVVYRDSVPFLPQDDNLTSLGVVKVPDGLEQQLGLVGFFYPTQAELGTGAMTSAYADLYNPVLTLRAYVGDLGIDDGTPRSVYTLDPSGMEEIAGPDAEASSLELSPGQTVDLPGGRGSVTFEDETPEGADVDEIGYTESVKRFVSLQVHHDASTGWVLAFAILLVAGLITALLVPRRRLWVKVTPDGDGARVEYAGLARGEDPAIRRAVDELAAQHEKDLRG